MLRSVAVFSLALLSGPALALHVQATGLPTASGSEQNSADDVGPSSGTSDNVDSDAARRSHAPLRLDGVELSEAYRNFTAALGCRSRVDARLGTDGRTIIPGRAPDAEEVLIKLGLLASNINNLRTGACVDGISRHPKLTDRQTRLLQQLNVDAYQAMLLSVEDRFGRDRRVEFEEDLLFLDWKVTERFINAMPLDDSRDAIREHRKCPNDSLFAQLRAQFARSDARALVSWNPELNSEDMNRRVMSWVERDLAVRKKDIVDEKLKLPAESGEGEEWRSLIAMLKQILYDEAGVLPDSGGAFGIFFFGGLTGKPRGPWESWIW